jgi:hypothetical protein
MIFQHTSDTQLHALAARATAALPTAVNGRIEKACRLIRSASVELHEDDTATVLSESDGLTGYFIQHGQCTCPDFQFQAPEGWCAHRIAAGMAKRLSTMAQVQQSTPDATHKTSDTHDPLEASLAISERLRPYIVYLHSRPFVLYAGLLALAHERGLVSLKAHLTSVTSELAVAEAEATFADGRTFTESADATPGNVGAKVRAHFPRMALTRAKARCLRDALNVGLVTLEELEN